MPLTKLLKLKLKSGLLSDLHSDTVFGHFCWRLKDRLGNNGLAEFLALYKNRKPAFTISDGLLSQNNALFFPKPFLFFPANNENIKSKKDKIEAFLKYKDIKKRKFITFSELNLLLEGKLDDYFESLKAYYTVPELKTILKISVEIDREKLKSKEGQLFSYSPSFTDENVFINFLIKILDESKFGEFGCEQVLKDVFEIGYGKKKSSGYGQFEILSIDNYAEIMEPDESNGFLTLSNYLPSNDDGIIDYRYELLLKDGRMGEGLALSEQPFKNPIIFMKPGSVIWTDDKKDFYGRCTIDGEINPAIPETIQNGIAFTLKLNIPIK